ncbi:hypothetical protein ZWY2020_036544 [Hordeum vulgare]|nr:hypothetical protein ZWY2020_036544 [Hordeum vulgare]
MPRSGSIQNQARSGDANDAVFAWLPRDVLANVLLRLPASDLRRFRRICKEWREVMSDPSFIDAHMVQGPRGLTHTIVFFLGRSGDDGSVEPQSGDGYLFDEQWRLVARFKAGESQDMVGTCNGLLCFLDVHQGAISVVEPFTGESLTLPAPPTERSHQRGAYCFGFDPSSKRHKVLHQGRDLHQDDTGDEHLYVYTIGGGDNWRRAHAAGVSHGMPVFADGSVVWWSMDSQLATRFDLATEEITSEPTELVGQGSSATLSLMTTGSDARVYVMTFGRLGAWDVFSMGEHGRWERYSSALPLRPPHMRYVAWPHPLQRGHLPVEDYGTGSHSCRGMYAHPIAPASAGLGSGKLLLKMAKGADGTPAKSNNARGLFVAVPREHEAASRVRRVPSEQAGARAFCYAPPVSPAPLSR